MQFPDRQAANKTCGMSWALRNTLFDHPNHPLSPSPWDSQSKAGARTDLAEFEAKNFSENAFRHSQTQFHQKILNKWRSFN
jgi:hypothetical protein